MARKSVINIGDVFEIPLNNGLKYYGQYVYFDTKHGPIIRIFDYATVGREAPNLSKINTSKLVFSPVYAGVIGAVRADVWSVVGTLPLRDYIFSGFISDLLETPKNREEPVKVKRWFLWDGKKHIDLGKKLPKKYQNYESTAVYPADMIVQRIETGFDMFEYPKKYNRFMTKEEIKQKYPSVKI